MTKRTIEVFSAGCPCCDATLEVIREVACDACDVQVLDMKDPEVAVRAKQLGINRVPAVVIDGQLADCCSSGAIDVEVLRSMGLGQP
ncbi:MAG: thioredoxin family protein [Deltaproteobacteria bacterium]|nr:thioredoxin family protein [Deltaproteobacteria bacterium]